MAPSDRLAALWMNSLVFPIFCSRQRAISSASWSILFFKVRKRSPRVLMARRDTLERRLVTLERDGRGPLSSAGPARAPDHTKHGALHRPGPLSLPSPRPRPHQAGSRDPAVAQDKTAPFLTNAILGVIITIMNSICNLKHEICTPLSLQSTYTDHFQFDRHKSPTGTRSGAQPPHGVRCTYCLPGRSVVQAPAPWEALQQPRALQPSSGI